jgi:hypothetical protein
VNYSISEAVVASQNSSQMSLRLQKANDQGFDGPFAVKVVVNERRLMFKLF